MYFFGKENLLGKKIKIMVKDQKERKMKERKALVVHDDPKLLVVRYLDLGWCEGFNQGDFADGTIRLVGGF